MADMEDDFVTPDVVNSDDNSDDEPVADDDRSHNKLLNAISALDGKKILKQVQRSEPAREISEFTLSTSSDKVKLHQLVGALRNTASHGQIRKQLNRVDKKQTLNVPLPKHEKERVERVVAYEATTKEVTKWDPVVQEIRAKETLSFPLEQPGFKLITTDEAVKRFQPRTPLELEIAQLLHGSKNVFKKEKMLTPAEERALRAMNLEEAKQRRAELQKYRALLSYQEAKARRQGKIKSKKYHRVLRKEREKGQKKALDELEKKDPEAYVEKLKKIEKDRVQERMSLKHRGGSKKMKKQMIYGKYDGNVRQAVQDMIQKSKELKEKNVNMESDSDENNDDNHGNETELIDVALATTASGEKNPWMLPPSVKKVSEFSRLKEVVNEDNITKNKTTDTEERVEENSVVNNKEKSGELDIDELFEEMQRKRGALHIEKDDEEFVGKKARKKKKAEKLKAKRKAKKEAEKLRKKQKFEEYVELGSDPESDNVDNDSANKKNKNSNKQTSKCEGKRATDRQEDSNNNNDDDYNDDDNGEEIIHSSLTRKRTLEDMEGNWSDDDVEASSKKRQGNVDVRDQNVTESSSGPGTDVRIDPKNVVAVETSIRSSLNPNVVSDDDNDSDDGDVDEETRQRMTIAQAFADDDVIEEFRQEKSDKEARDKPKDINLYIPGWGDWAGGGIQPSKRKLKRFRIKAPPAPPRKDMYLDNVIISETKDNTIAKHQVSQIPFPFGSVHEFESSVRAPIGRTWNPETAFRKLTQPKKVTQLGAIIDPIDKSEMFKKQRALAEKRKQTEKDRGKKRKKGGIKNKNKR